MIGEKYQHLEIECKWLQRSMKKDCGQERTQTIHLLDISGVGDVMVNLIQRNFFHERLMTGANNTKQEIPGQALEAAHALPETHLRPCDC
jgi:hypothetical protein